MLLLPESGSSVFLATLILAYMSEFTFNSLFITASTPVPPAHSTGVTTPGSPKKQSLSTLSWQPPVTLPLSSNVLISCK
jgi:hypothetical protein